MKRNPLTLFVAFFVIIIFGLLLFVYEVRKSEAAVVTRFGAVNRVKTESGPGLRLPWPIEKVYKLDQRIQNLEGKFEQFKLPDQNIIFLSVYVGFRIEDPRAFFPKYTNASVTDAKQQLEDLVRSAKNEVAGQHPFSDFVSTDERQMKFAQIENEILQKVRAQVAGLSNGLDITSIQIRKIGLPASVTKTVFDRMTSERKTYINSIQSQGEKAAKMIKSEADSQAFIALADADAQAKIIRGDGEAQMMTNLAVLQQNPALANFLMQNSALQQLLKDKTTLVLDASSSPLQWLQMTEPAVPEPSHQATNSTLRF
jgi:membrane protease subunit HflC